MIFSIIHKKTAKTDNALERKKSKERNFPLFDHITQIAKKNEAVILEKGMWCHLSDEIDEHPVTLCRKHRKEICNVVHGYVLCVILWNRCFFFRHPSKKLMQPESSPRLQRYLCPSPKCVFKSRLFDIFENIYAPS